MRKWPFFWGVSRDSIDWFAEGKADIALPPAGPAGPKSWWGGWGFSVPTYAPHKEEALDLIRWITSNENTPVLARAQSWFVTPRKPVLDAMGDEMGALVLTKQISLAEAMKQGAERIKALG